MVKLASLGCSIGAGSCLRVNLRLLGRRLAYARLDGPVASSRDPSITGQLLVQNLVTRRERGGQHAPEGGVT